VSIKGGFNRFIGELFLINEEALGMVVNISIKPKYNLKFSGIILLKSDKISVGVFTESTIYLILMNAGDFMVGSLVDPLGDLIFINYKLTVGNQWLIESSATGIISRQSVFEPLLTGLLSIDGMIPVGRGQRELILGDRQTGKTSIRLDTILNQKFEKVFAVYIAIIQKASAILELFLAIVSRDAIFYVLVISGTSSSLAIFQFLSPYTGLSYSEFFMFVRELPALIIFDDLSRHAVAYREIYLLLRRPPGREAYPGEIFFVHSKLLERSAKLSKLLGAGSITALPLIETLAGDVSGYITTNVISITDGQIFLAIDLFLVGIKPAIDVGLSVTRVGSAAQWFGMKLVASSYKLELGQFVELQAFSQFASDLGDDTRKKLARGLRLVELLKQEASSPIKFLTQVIILSLANQNLVEKIKISILKSFIFILEFFPSWVFLLLSVRLLSNAVVLRIF
jgi:F-type H+-transporting ATPase subunit alpha